MREAAVYCEIHPNDVVSTTSSAASAQGHHPERQPRSTYEDHELRAPQAVWDAGVPVLGICYGMQTMAVQLGGKVEWSDHREFGYAEVRAHGHTKLLGRHPGLHHRRGPRHAQGLDEPRRPVTALPPGFKPCLDAAAPWPAWPPRTRATTPSSSTPKSRTPCRPGPSLTRFVRGIAGCKGDWIMGDHIEGSGRPHPREQVGNEEVILRPFRWRRPSVAAALIHRAIGDQLTCVFVDHGLLRLNEATW